MIHNLVDKPDTANLMQERMIQKNSVLIIGQGAIGTFLGSALQNNAEIAHFVRDSKQASKSALLKFNDRRKRKHKVIKGSFYKYRLLQSISNIQEYEYIIIPVSHRHFRSVIEMIGPHVHAKQTVVLSGNIWDEYSWFEKSIPCPYLFAFPNFGGTIKDHVLHGWLTGNFTIGASHSTFNDRMSSFQTLLHNNGFKARIEKDIRGWLMTHFAYNGGMFLQAIKDQGFQEMTKRFSSLAQMYRGMQECMLVVHAMGVDTQQFREGRIVNQPVWWNVVKTYLMFLLPGLAKSADASKNLEEWESFGKTILRSAKELRISTPLLDAHFQQ